MEQYTTHIYIYIYVYVCVCVRANCVFMCVCVWASVCMHAYLSISINHLSSQWMDFCEIFMFHYFFKISRENSSFVKNRQDFTSRPTCVHL